VSCTAGTLQKDVILNGTEIRWCVGLCFMNHNLYEMHKLITVFKSECQFSGIEAAVFYKSVVFPAVSVA
jgi:hypothetical protein